MRAMRPIQVGYQIARLSVILVFRTMRIMMIHCQSAQVGDYEQRLTNVIGLHSPICLTRNLIPERDQKSWFRHYLVSTWQEISFVGYPGTCLRISFGERSITSVNSGHLHRVPLHLQKFMLGVYFRYSNYVPCSRKAKK